MATLNSPASTDSLDSLTFAEHDLVASICRESYFDFVQEFWDEIVPEEPVWNWHIPLLCREYQRLAERVFASLPKEYDLIVNVPPGMTKSITSSIMLPAWVWTRMPTARFICSSFADDLVMDLSLKCRDLIESEKYRRCFPYVRLRDDQNAKGKFINTFGGARYTATVGGKSPMGKHAHFHINDDLIDPKQAASEESIKTAKRFTNEIMPSRMIDKAVTPTILVQQRLHQDDPSGDWLSRKGKSIRHICLPAEETEDIRPLRLRKHYRENGGLLDPVRLPREVLEEIKLNGSYAYAGQYLQNPIPLGGGMFKVERLKIDTPPVRLSQIVRYWDKAYTGAGGAYTVGVKMGVEMRGRLPHYWVLDVVRGQWDSWERESIIQNTAKLDGRDVVIGVEQEPAAGKESANNTARGLAGFRVVKDLRGGKSDEGKVIRADPFATQVNAINVSLAAAGWNEAYIDELRHFPASRYKDQVDASSGAFAMLVKNRVRVGAL